MEKNVENLTTNKIDFVFFFLDFRFIETIGFCVFPTKFIQSIRWKSAQLVQFHIDSGLNNSLYIFRGSVCASRPTGKMIHTELNLKISEDVMIFLWSGLWKLYYAYVCACVLNSSRLCLILTLSIFSLYHSRSHFLFVLLFFVLFFFFFFYVFFFLSSNRWT